MQTSTVTQTVTVPVPPPPGANAPAALAATLYLDDIEPIEESLNKASITWKGQTFSRSLTNPLSGCSARGPVDWVIPSGVDKFESEIGVATDAAEPDSRVTFNVYLDGRMAHNETLSVGEHKPIVVALSDAFRLRVETIIDQNRRGNCNTEATAVWGDPRLV